MDERDNNEYLTVKIGDQIWMAENLAYKAKSGFAPYLNDEFYTKYFGYYYSYTAACESIPKGWRIPTAKDWEKLIEYCGGKDIAKSKLITNHPKHWKLSKMSNESGFSAISGGCGDGGFIGDFDTTRSAIIFWTSTKHTENDDWIYGYALDDLLHDGLHRKRISDKRDLLNVRCIKNDSELTITKKINFLLKILNKIRKK